MVVVIGFEFPGLAIDWNWRKVDAKAQVESQKILIDTLTASNKALIDLVLSRQVSGENREDNPKST